MAMADLPSNVIPNPAQNSFIRSLSKSLSKICLFIIHFGTVERQRRRRMGGDPAVQVHSYYTFWKWTGLHGPLTQLSLTKWVNAEEGGGTVGIYYAFGYRTVAGCMDVTTIILRR